MAQTKGPNLLVVDAARRLTTFLVLPRPRRTAGVAAVHESRLLRSSSQL